MPRAETADTVERLPRLVDPMTIALCHRFKGQSNTAQADFELT